MNLPLKTLIVEDRDDDLALLRFHLSAYPNIIAIEKGAMTFESARNILLNESFDLSLLDIDLGSNDCYELIRQVGQHPFGIIAFSTQSTSVPLEVSKTLPGHLHLPKPYSEPGTVLFIKELHEEIKRRVQSFSISRPFESQLPLLIKDVQDKQFAIEMHKIMFIEVKDGICKISYEDNSTIKLSQTKSNLKDFENILNTELFHRINRECLVNLKFIQSYKNGTITLKKIGNDLRTLSVSERNIPGFLARFPQK